jgi:hypothetical protein
MPRGILSRRSDTGQISWGKLSRLRRTVAESTLRILLDMDFAVRCPLVRCLRLVVGFCPSTHAFARCFLQTPPRGGSPCTLLALHLHQVGQKTFTSKLLSMPSAQRNRSRGRALRQAARSTRPVLTMRSGNLTQDRSNCMTDKTRSPGAWAHDRRQDDWAITPKIQQATSAPPKIRMTKPVRSDRRRPS